jgi:hypothetical protein
MKIDINTNIEDVIFPNNGKLIKRKGIATATIIDEELDPIECAFNNDGCVQLKTDGYSYITLSVDNLFQLMDLIEDSDEYYKKYYSKKN